MVQANEKIRAPEAKPWGFHPAPMLDSMVDMQKQMFEYAAELSQVWTTRAQSESELATNFATKLANARSIPEAMSAWQECVQQRIQLNADDAQRLFDQNRRFIQVGADLLSNGGIGTTS